MNNVADHDQSVADGIIALARSERAKALSPREWKHRLAGYGYGVRESDHGMIIESLFSRTPPCVLPRDICG